MRVVMYSPDSIGLGHMRRNATVAAELVRQKPASSVALLIGSGAGAFFALPKGVDTIKLPSVQKVTSEIWRARSLNLSVDETSQVRAGIVQNVVRSLKPDVLLVDHLPMGVCRDLLPALEMIKREQLDTQVVLGLRDILDEPELIRRRWRTQGQYGFITSYYDAVLIYGDRAVYPSGEHYGLDACLPDRVFYTGYVCSSFESARDTRGDPTTVRGLPGLTGWTSGERVIVAAGGGGHDAFPMLEATLSALKRLDNDPSIRAVIIAGPLMPEPDRQRLEQMCHGLKRVQIVPWTADCMDYLSAADVAIIMAGYNSSLEALSTRARVIMLPRPGPSGEQRIRARMLAERNLVDTIEAAAASPEIVEKSILAALSMPPRQPSSEILGGATVAARKIVDLAERPLRKLPEQHQVRSRYVMF